MKELTHEQKVTICSRIRELRRAGVGIATIAARVHRNIEVVRRVLAGKGVYKENDAPIDGLPTIQGAFDKNGWPVDEWSTTESIYAAAEAIRQVRPRRPLGYEDKEIEFRASIDVKGLPRGGRSKL
jgi:hypothetical protein